MPANAAQSYDLDSWFSRFADNLQQASRVNPMTRLLDLDREINPYFVTFAMYFYRVPGNRTVSDRGKRTSKDALSKLRKIPERLLQVAEDMRFVLECELPQPWANQIRELIAKDTTLLSRAGELQSLPALCKSAAPLFERWHEILKDQTSGKRDSRAAYGTIFWLHLTRKIPKIPNAAVGEIVPILIDCADDAFGLKTNMTQWNAIERKAERYRERFPQDYKRRLGEASRSRGLLSDQEYEMWRRLDPTDCLSIIESLRLRFARELQRT